MSITQKLGEKAIFQGAPKSKKISILKFYIINNGIISPEGMSGSDQRALNWANIFKDKAHDVTMIIPEEGESRYRGFNCIVTAKGVLPGGIGLVISYIWRGMKTAQIMKRINEDIDDRTVIYSSSDLLPDTIPAIYAKVKRPTSRWVTGLHLIAPNPFKGFKKTSTSGYTLPAISNMYYFLSQRLVMRFMKRYVHTVMVSNSLDREFLLKKGFMPDKVIVTYGAVDWEAINKAARKKPEFDACYVGRFHKQKGFPDLIEAWKQVCKRYPKALLAIIGNDINFDEMVKKVKNKGISENIKFLGFLNGVSKFSIMKSSKLCVFPSTYESFGMVAAEAMACGLPVVAYDLPVYKEIYPVGMLKANIGDINGLAAYVLDLFLDEKKRQRVSKDAYGLSQKFTWEKTADKILKRLN